MADRRQKAGLSEIGLLCEELRLCKFLVDAGEFDSPVSDPLFKRCGVAGAGQLSIEAAT